MKNEQISKVDGKIEVDGGNDVKVRIPKGNIGSQRTNNLAYKHDRAKRIQNFLLRRDGGTKNE
jgi:hypothetical protein